MRLEFELTNFEAAFHHFSQKGFQFTKEEILLITHYFGMLINNIFNVISTICDAKFDVFCNVLTPH